MVIKWGIREVIGAHLSGHSSLDGHQWGHQWPFESEWPSVGPSVAIRVWMAISGAISGHLRVRWTKEDPEAMGDELHDHTRQLRVRLGDGVSQ